MKSFFLALKRLVFWKKDEHDPPEKKEEVPDIKPGEVTIVRRPEIVVPDLDYKHARPWLGIVIHHSASKDTPARDTDAIRRYHTSFRVDFKMVSSKEFKRLRSENKGGTFQKPWDDIAYHLMIERVGDEPTVVPGRSLSKSGAHSNVKGITNYFNERWIGICCIGNHDAREPDNDLWLLSLSVVRGLAEKLGLRNGNVVGHGEVFDRLGLPRNHSSAHVRTCPGTMWDMEKFRSEI